MISQFCQDIKVYPWGNYFCLGFFCFFPRHFNFACKFFFAVNDGSRLPFLSLVVGHRAILYFHTHELQEEKICSSCSLVIIKAISNHFILTALSLKLGPSGGWLKTRFILL